MKRLRNISAVVIALGTMTIGSVLPAQELPSAKTAYKQLYSIAKKPTEVRILREDLIPANLLPAIKAAATVQKYYEALALSPSEGIQGGSAFQAVNYHTPETANAAALAGCNAKKKKESEACVVVAQFVPKKYEGAGDFSLSYVASVEFAHKYRRKSKHRAFAISLSTGNWGHATGAASQEAAKAAAIADCAQKSDGAGAGDCAVVSVD